MPLSRRHFEPIPVPSSAKKTEGPDPSAERGVIPTPEAGPRPSPSRSALEAQENTPKTAELTRIARMPVQAIHIVGRKADTRAPEDALHMYIDITHVEHGREHHEILEALPMGKNGPPEDGNLAHFHSHDYLKFVPGGEADSDKPKSPNKTLIQSKALTPPGHENVTQYADSLREGALASNNHLHRYDFLGQRGYNSNSWVYSLVHDRGGSAGQNDLDTFTKDHILVVPTKYNSRVSPENPDDLTIDTVAVGLGRKKYVAPGWTHRMPGNTFDKHRKMTVHESVYTPNDLKIGISIAVNGMSGVTQELDNRVLGPTERAVTGALSREVNSGIGAPIHIELPGLTASPGQTHPSGRENPRPGQEPPQHERQQKSRSFGIDF